MQREALELGEVGRPQAAHWVPARARLEAVLHLRPVDIVAARHIVEGRGGVRVRLVQEIVHAGERRCGPALSLVPRND